MKLGELEVYYLSEKLSAQIWNIVQRWDSFCADTIGKQIVRSADSISANIAEGFGRYHFKENKHFCYYARGSLFETKSWINKSVSRDLISKEEFELLEKEIKNISVKLNNYIRSIG